MKAKVIIENGKSQIELSCENEFEKHIVDKVVGKRSGYEIKTSFNSDNEYGYTYNNSNRKNQRINIDITEAKETIVEEQLETNYEGKSVFLVVDNRDGTIYGCFNDKAKATKYKNENSNMLLRKIQVL